MRSKVAYYDEGNKHSRHISFRELVEDPQFKSGYRDRSQGLRPRRFYYDEDVGERFDAWGYERGRLIATWLLATGQKLPKASDTTGLMHAYFDADDAGVVL